MPVSGQMQVGEDGLPGPQAPALLRLRLLDLDDQLRTGKQLADIRFEPCARGAILRIGKSGALTCSALHADGMTGCGQLAHTGRRQRHAVFAVLDLTRHCNAHG